MTKIKLCGLSRPQDIGWANDAACDYIGFVFAKNSRRYVDPAQAARLKKQLNPDIQTVGVFVRESVENVARLLEERVIDIAQLHGGEDEDYIRALRKRTHRPLIQAFRVDSQEDAASAEKSSADFILLDSGSGGTGTLFDWNLIRSIRRPYFLAGGLEARNVSEAVKTLRPYAVDVSSGIESEGVKDPQKIADFVAAVRKEDFL